MIKSLILVLAFPLQVGHPPQPTNTTFDILGLTAIVGPPKYGVGLGGISMTSTIEVAGGKGILEGHGGLLKEKTAHIVIKEAKVEEIAKAVGGAIPAWLKPKLVGRITTVTVDLKGDDVTLVGTGFRIPGDPVSRIELKADLKTRKYKAKLYALGGLVTAEGTLPEDK